MSQATFARPYARAVFGYACEQEALPQFSDMLALAATLVGDDRVRELLINPRLSRERRCSMLLELGEGQLDAPMRQFLQILGDRDRLLLLPEIAQQFEDLRAEHEQRLTAEVVSARALDDAQQEQIRAELAARTGRAVELSARTDEQLLGGAIVRAGDRVLDASLRGRLQQLAQSLA